MIQTQSSTKISIDTTGPIVGAIVFTILKLSHAIDISWWWITLVFLDIASTMVAAVGVLIFENIRSLFRRNQKDSDNE